MTLNLMLTSRWAVYLSGDFRLTCFKPDGSTSWTDDPNTQKLVPIFRFGWSALVAFTGVAATRDVPDVGDWLSQQLDSIDLHAGFEELPKRLLAAEAWLRRVTGERRVAFSVVGYVGKRPYTIVISNFLDLDGHVFDPPLHELRCFERRPKVAEVRVAGVLDAVTADERDRLKKLLTASREQLDVHTALAEVNAAAAARCEYISRECVTGCLMPSGAAGVIPHGIPDGVEYVPRFVHRHFAAMGIVGFRRKLDAAGRPLPPRWLQTTAKVESRGRRDQRVLVGYEVANVGEPVAGNVPPNTWLFWKIAQANEPPVKVLFHRPERSR